MAQSFLAAAAHRHDDVLLHSLVKARLDVCSGGWAIEWRGQAGRTLVATRALPANTLVFTEPPLCAVAGSSTAALAREMLQLSRGKSRKADRAALHLLQSNGRGAFFEQAISDAEREREDGRTAAEARWARGVAHINAHGAGEKGGTLRTVVGVLGSMMAHSCSPSAAMRIADDGSNALSLHTLRAVAAGEALDITYCAVFKPRAWRRKMLQQQHGFTCDCRRCASEPELTRAFSICPNCEEGPCSPATPEPSCRSLLCDGCGAEARLSDEAWLELEAAEQSEDASECMSVCHPYHWKMVEMYTHSLHKLPAAGRAEVVLQHAGAHARLLGEGHPLVARHLERAAAALQDAGEHKRASDTLTDAARRLAAAYGVASPEAKRACRAAVAARTRVTQQ
eukprot:Transcript_24031.p3 GENE.Transcript_24031~~Transcript_24031.p3  ORF type:complete len:396 (+),score=109.55 Transcript_24031:105-1292(+)